MERYISITEAAEMLSVSESTIRRAMSDDRLPVYRFGRSVRFHEADVLALLTPAKREATHDS